MNCKHCGKPFTPANPHAQQGSLVQCPSCGESTRVRYTIEDELKDPVGAFMLRDLKYANPMLITIALIILVPFFLIAAAMALSDDALPEAKFIIIAVLIVGSLSLAQYIARYRSSKADK